MIIQKYWCAHKVNRTSSSGSYDGGGSAPIYYNMYPTLSSSFFIGHTSQHFTKSFNFTYVSIRGTIGKESHERIRATEWAHVVDNIKSFAISFWYYGDARLCEKEGIFSKKVAQVVRSGVEWSEAKNFTVYFTLFYYQYRRLTIVQDRVSLRLGIASHRGTKKIFLCSWRNKDKTRWWWWCR